MKFIRGIEYLVRVQVSKRGLVHREAREVDRRLERAAKEIAVSLFDVPSSGRLPSVKGK
jgi:predicted TIM-barrel enzyme